jgi:hypothetical protein
MLNLSGSYGKLHFTRSIFSFIFATGIKIIFSVELQKLKQSLILLSEADKSIGDRDILNFLTT